MIPNTFVYPNNYVTVGLVDFDTSVHGHELLEAYVQVCQC